MFVEVRLFVSVLGPLGARVTRARPLQEQHRWTCSPVVAPPRGGGVPPKHDFAVPLAGSHSGVPGTVTVLSGDSHSRGKN